MRNLKILAGLFLFGIGFLYIYNNHNSPLSSKPLPLSSDIKYNEVDMNDRMPSFKLATNENGKPYADGDRAQATVVGSLRLLDRCKQNSSLIVVDVGAYLGDFGLYAAACGCQVYLFEVQPNMVTLIRKSIEINNFPVSRVQIIQRAVSDLPSNSQLTFSIQGGSTTASNGSLQASTIRLDDFEWPTKSTILLLKVDVEGFELGVLRSAEKLFQEKRIQHLIFEYTAWWTDRSAQKELLPFVENRLGATQLFALDRRDTTVYGPLNRTALNQFHDDHVQRHLQTDIYAIFTDSRETSLLNVKPYVTGKSYA